MSDYIDRNEILKKIRRYGLCDGSVLGLHSGAAEELIEQVETFPSADVAPVVHAQWIPCENGGYYCSNCDRRVAFMVHQYYCSHCGAKMSF